MSDMIEESKEEEYSSDSGDYETCKGPEDFESRDESDNDDDAQEEEGGDDFELI
jgi:hypothetical protein